MSETDEQLAVKVLDASKKIHDIECGCPYSGEHAGAELERWEGIARAVLETKASATPAAQVRAAARALCAAENAGGVSWDMVTDEQREWYASQAEVALRAARGVV